MSAPAAARKEYTLVATRHVWTPDEHAKFLELLEKHGRDWVAIQKELGDKTLGQIRSHSQKYFERMLKIGNADAVPKARAKKRSDKPYPVQSNKRARLSRADSISTAATAAMAAETDDGRSESVAEASAASLLTDNISAAAELAANAAMAAMEAVRGGNKKKKKAVPPQQPQLPQQQQPDFGRVYRILSSAIEGSEQIEDLMKGISDLSPLDSKSFHMLLSNLVCNLERQLDSNDLNTGAEAGGSRT